MKKIICLLFFLLTPLTTFSSLFTGESLLESCNLGLNMMDNTYLVPDDNLKVTQDLMKSTKCVSYIAGIVEMDQIMGLSLNRDKSPHLIFCIPDNIHTITVIRVVVNYLKNHPEYFQQPSSVLVSSALLQAYPCLKNKNSM